MVLLIIYLPLSVLLTKTSSGEYPGAISLIIHLLLLLLLLPIKASSGEYTCSVSLIIDLPLLVSTLSRRLPAHFWKIQKGQKAKFMLWSFLQSTKTSYGNVKTPQPVVDVYVAIAHTPSAGLRSHLRYSLD